MKQGLPESFRPLLWSYRFEDIDPDKHKEEIILNTVNYGTLKQWHWIIGYYGKNQIRSVLENRLESEVTPESRHLSRLIFNVKNFRYAR
jgi:hypothetical protein